MLYVARDGDLIIRDVMRSLRSGSFITIYLSPRHYHRIHSPCEGRITAAWHLPGVLLPVNEPAVPLAVGLQR